MSQQSIKRCYMNFQKNNIWGFPSYNAFKSLIIPIITLYEPEA